MPSLTQSWTYDAHGNMVATLSKSGTNGYALSNQRSFDAWGNVRIGSTSGYPTGRYCANIGHKQDDESGLIYMRARYYEPTSGRFTSQDPYRSGLTYFDYACNDPNGNCDPDGKKSSDLTTALGGVGWGFIAMAMIITSYSANPADIALSVCMTAIGIALVGAASIVGSGSLSMKGAYAAVSAALVAGLLYSAKELAMIASMNTAMCAGTKTAARAAVVGCYFYAVTCLVLLKEMDWEDTMAGVLVGLAVPGPPL